MVKSGLYSAIRYTTSHESDLQVPDAYLDAIVPPLYIAFRRRIVQTANKLYSTYSTPSAVLTAAAPTIALPADYEQLIRVEMLDTGGQYLPVDAVNALNPEDSTPRGWAEQEGLIRIFPAANAGGTYRLFYNKKPAVTGDYLIEVPEGCELVLMDTVCAVVRKRFNEDWQQHDTAARLAWNDPQHPGTGLQTTIRRAYGNHPVPGFRGIQGA